MNPVEVGKQHSPAASLFHDDPVAFRVQLFGSAHLFRFREDVHGDLQVRKLFRADGRKSGVLRRGSNGILPYFIRQGAVAWEDGPDAPSELSVLFQSDEARRLFRQFGGLGRSSPPGLSPSPWLRPPEPPPGRRGEGERHGVPHTEWCLTEKPAPPLPTEPKVDQSRIETALSHLVDLVVADLEERMPLVCREARAILASKGAPRESIRWESRESPCGEVSTRQEAP